jgi:hypothetical protein
MEARLIIPLVLTVIIVGTEYVFWRLFMKRLGGLLLPQEADGLLLRIFDVPRLRLVAIAHTLLLLGFCLLVFVWLW